MPRMTRIAPRAQGPVSYYRQSWAYLILVVILATLTSPLWFFNPSPDPGSREQFRMVGGIVWIAVGTLAVIGGHRWRSLLTLDSSGRTVSRPSSLPWSSTILWSYSGSEIYDVFLELDRQGRACLQASIRGGAALVIEKGRRQEDLEVLGKDVASCWNVPFKNWVWDRRLGPARSGLLNLPAPTASRPPRKKQPSGKYQLPYSPRF